MKRKRVVIVTGNQRVAQAIFSDVKAVFNNDVDIDIVYPSQIASLDAVEADAFLVTRWYNISGLTDKVSSKSKVVRTTRTISESGYKKITQIPPGTNVLVVNDSEQSTPGMKNMFDDMGGAAAVIGAMTAVADQKLKANVIGVIAACENKIAADAYVPGDIIGSMSGKTIEVISADAEGRLTLADAVTYIQRKESCRFVADIATLTGSAKTAVGKYSAAVLTNNEELYASAREASRLSAEKIWRLDNDREMLPCIKTPVADLKNAGNATVDGGGCMLGGMFVGEFIENDIPWIHIDMAPVNFRTEPPAYCAYGATGYGASLLYHLVKQLQSNA